MNRLVRAAVAAAVAIGVATTGAVIAEPAGAATPRLNGTDAKFLRSNEQVNLTEIGLAAIELKRATGPAAIALARLTLKDHLYAALANVKLSRSIGVVPPRTVDASQLAALKTLLHTPRVNREYFVIQIIGHNESIAATKYEIAHGIRPRVVAFAKAYLPVAESHLFMAERDLAVWTHLFG